MSSGSFVRGGAAPYLPAKIFPAEVRYLKLSGKFPVGLGTPPPNIRFCLSQTPSDIQNLSTEIGRNQYGIRQTGRTACQTSRL